MEAVENRHKWRDPLVELPGDEVVLGVVRAAWDDKSRDIVEAVYYHDGHWYLDDGETMPPVEVRWWMPLPEPPEGTRGD